MVLRVDTEKGYIDLSKRRVSPEDAAACDEKYNKSKLVHTITRHAAETTNTDLEDLYKAFTWPLYKKHGHANDAFKNMVTSPEEMFDQAIEISGEEGAAVLTPEVRSAIVKDIKRRNVGLCILRDILGRCRTCVTANSVQESCLQGWPTGRQGAGSRRSGAP